MEGRHYRRRIPTERQRQALEAYLRLGSYRRAAAHLGISYRAFHRRLSGLYISMRVYGVFEAARTLGYLSLAPKGKSRKRAKRVLVRSGRAFAATCVTPNSVATK